MAHITGKRPKLVLYPTKPVPPTAGTAEGDFVVYASYRGTEASGFYGKLKVVRTTDGRLLYPFDGAAPIGPFPTKQEASVAAVTLGTEIVAADLAYPEL
ncbi:MULTISPECIES: DUF6723 family protein [unclassified Caballeronia]|uniref:DUF6723 family protein n=1 Tax=unclassified Caballeronia TaxID=2646786 RepID=UPI002861BF4F|nr:MULTISPECIES: DUF6723 family protein [unclassified Caballeronia]MDR5777533.1 hypothetical protein [Caballeronia sp. LZ002]MDR5852961.1 hypothetical protein [Caballeronia sp. LZ003]